MTGGRVRRLRCLAGLTQAQAAQAAGISTSTWHQVERGDPIGLSMTTLIRISVALNCSPGALLPERPKPGLQEKSPYIVRINLGKLRLRLTMESGKPYDDNQVVRFLLSAGFCRYGEFWVANDVMLDPLRDEEFAIVGRSPRATGELDTEPLAANLPRSLRFGDPCTRSLKKAESNIK